MNEELVQAVYLPAFVKCCHDNGVTDPNAIQNLLETAAMYRAQEQGSQETQIKQANESLREQLGVAQPNVPQEVAMHKEAADALRADPQVRQLLASLLQK
jgi:hypothetical protein